MKPRLTRLAGWSALLRIVVVVGGVVIVALLTALQKPVEIVQRLLAAFEVVLTLPVVYALAALLSPHEGARAWASALLGAIGYLGGLVVTLMLLTHEISTQAATGLLVDAALLAAGWVLWVNWQLWRNALLKGALPWIGIAYALSYLAGLTFTVGGLTRVGEVGVLYIGQVIWYVWLGILLIRDKVTAYA